jgi:chemotaxis family two-component system sensor kinase Cph1
MLRGLLQYTVTTPSSVHRAEVLVTTLMESVLRELQTEINQAAADITVDAKEGLTIVGDKEMLRILAAALIQNAVKFRRSDVSPVVRVKFDRQPRQWSMTVTDNGAGIDERFVDRMFEMFARFHPVGEHPGAGVGLALSKRIVDCHNGRLSVERNPSGPGSVFTVVVPISSSHGKTLSDTQRFPY